MLPVFFLTHQFITECGFPAIFFCLYRYLHKPSCTDHLFCKCMYLLHVFIIKISLFNDSFALIIILCEYNNEQAEVHVDLMLRK